MRAQLLLTTLVLVLAVASVRAQDALELDLGLHTVSGTRSDRLFAVQAVDDLAHQRLVDVLRVADAHVVEDLADRRIRVYTTRPDRIDDLVAWMQTRTDVVFARRLVHHGDPARPGSRWIPTQDVVVRFAPEMKARTVRRLVQVLGAETVRELDFLPGTRVLRLRRGVDPVTFAQRLEARGDVVFAHPDWLRKLDVRQHVPNDPLFGNQWHLRNTGQGFGVVGADIKATFAWQLSQGAGRVIAVIDTGVESGHSDIAQTANGYAPLTGASPTAADDAGNHGTRVAGVAAASGDNGLMVTGVAPAATIMPIKLLTGSGYGTPSEEAACFSYASDNGADVITNSWGPDGVPFPLPTLVDAAIQYATTTGRGGLGCPVFWASGNGAEDIATDGYVSSPFTIAVGASTNFDQRPAYSDYGAALDLLAPSSGGTRAINTTTPTSSTTLSFAGTSASAPQAAGVAALMLAANPNLTWVDVRALLRQTAQKIEPTVAAYGASGHSVTHGWGRLDAHQAVLAALSSSAFAPQLALWSWGVGDLQVAITGLPPFCEWVICFSAQIYTPLGSGPLFGVGFDGLYTAMMPAGIVPFHAWADATGSFSWGSTGLPIGTQLQAVAVGIQPGVGLLPSNAAQTVVQ